MEDLHYFQNEIAQCKWRRFQQLLQHFRCHFRMKHFNETGPQIGEQTFTGKSKFFYRW